MWMVIIPLIVAPLMVLVRGEVYEDPVFIVSSMLLMVSPPALTLTRSPNAPKSPPVETPTDVDTISPFERLLSRTVFWAYLVFTPPITMASILVGLLLINA